MVHGSDAQRATGGAHLLTTHAVLPLLVSERSHASFLCSDPLRLLQRLTNRPRGDLSVLVVPSPRRSITSPPSSLGTYEKTLRQVVLIVLVV